MKCLAIVALGVFLVSAPALAQDKAAKSAESKTMTATGSVSSVSADSLTVKGKTGEWTFGVDKSTHVAVAGASKKNAALKDSKTPTQITEFVKVGDTVTVKYHDMGTMKHAADVMVKNAAPAAAKK